MVVIVRLRGTALALSLVCLSSTALAHGPEVPRYLRTALDDDAAVSRDSREPRRFRTTLDDTNHAEFPLEDEGRLIRVSLDEGTVSYGRLSPHQARARHLRTVLD